MTTETPRTRPVAAVPGVRVAVAGCLAVGLGLLVPALSAGAAAVSGVLIGVTLVVGLLGSTTLAVNLVASQLPGASLMVALLTYVLVVLVLAVLFAGLRNASSVDTNWLAGTIVALVLVWTTLQVWSSVRARQLLYDLPGSAGGEDPA